MAVNLTNIIGKVQDVMKMYPEGLVTSDVVKATTLARKQCTLQNEVMSTETIENMTKKLIRAYRINSNTLVNKGVNLLVHNDRLFCNVETLKLKLNAQAGYDAKLISVYYSRSARKHVYIFSVRGEVLETSNSIPTSIYRHMLSNSVTPSESFNAMGAGVITDGLCTPSKEHMIEMAHHMLSVGENFSSSLISYLSMLDSSENKVSALIRGDIGVVYKFWKTSGALPYKELVKHSKKTPRGNEIKMDLLKELVTEEKQSILVGLTLANNVFKTLGETTNVNTKTSKDITVISTPKQIGGRLSSMSVDSLFTNEDNSNMFEVKGINSVYAQPAPKK